MIKVTAEYNNGMTYRFSINADKNVARIILNQLYGGKEHVKVSMTEQSDRPMPSAA